MYFFFVRTFFLMNWCGKIDPSLFLDFLKSLEQNEMEHVVRMRWKNWVLVGRNANDLPLAHSAFIAKINSEGIDFTDLILIHDSNWEKWPLMRQIAPLNRNHYTTICHWQELSFDGLKSLATIQAGCGTFKHSTHVLLPYYRDTVIFSGAPTKYAFTAQLFMLHR